ncbi:transmembrane protein 171 [Monodelphis domestica]|uniref:transmembrane protein 171 n=1 Tax=Monodelphis domestica TaxID=13616 RepID=UPI0024E2365D|nr:transmembrane protein 171 [Monodelphis domestica]
MSPATAPEPGGDVSGRRISKIIFFLFVFGVVLLCAGILLSIFGFQTCQYETLIDCSAVLKIVGPSCAVIGLGTIILARSRAKLQLRERQLQGNQVDPDTFFLCGESRQFAQFLIFGFLFLTSGMLISVLGIWVPGCNPGWPQPPFNDTDASSTEPQACGFLSLQIMGPLIVLIGLCFFVVAHIKKRHDLSSSQDSSESEERRSQNNEPVQVTVGDAVIIFPPPPPPYFSDASTSAVATHSSASNNLPPSENPPSYYSIFNYGTQTSEVEGAVSYRNPESIYTISGTNLSSETSLASHISSELPPRYEEKETVNVDHLTSSSSQSSPP